MALMLNKKKNDVTPSYLLGVVSGDIINSDSFYVVITSQKWDKVKSNITVSWVVNKESDEGPVEILSKEYYHNIDLESDINFVEQGYEYLKTLPEFEGAIDC